MQRELIGAAEDAAAAYRRDASIDSAVAAHNERIKQAYEAMVRAGFDAMAMDTYQRITGAKITAEKLEVKQDDDEIRIALNRAIDLYLRRYSATKITQITSTTMKQIRRDIRIAMEAGLSVAETAAMIAKRGRDLAGPRAAVIARTEIHSAANYGAIESAKLTGVVQRKVWLSVEDDRTRGADDNDEWDHSDVDPVGLNDVFKIRNLKGGTDAELMYPGDPNGPPGAIINCRCAMGYEV
jgi:hypothetical protein